MGRLLVRNVRIFDGLADHHFPVMSWSRARR